MLSRQIHGKIEDGGQRHKDVVIVVSKWPLGILGLASIDSRILGT